MSKPNPEFEQIDLGLDRPAPLEKPDRTGPSQEVRDFYAQLGTEPPEDIYGISDSDIPQVTKTRTPRTVSRRTFAGIILAASLVGLELGSMGKINDALASQLPNIPAIFGGQNQGENPGENSVNGIQEGPAKSGTIQISGTETSFQQEMLGYLSWTPDGPISYYTTAEGKRRYLLTGGKDNATYMLETDGKQTLAEIMTSGQINGDSFKEVFGPDVNVEYRKYYAGIASVVQDPQNPDHLWGFVHGENRITRDASASFTATVGLAESTDGGLTWIDKGPIIKGDDPQEPGKDVSGAGQPTAIYNPKDGFVYIMYVDWARVNYHHPDQIYLARMKVNNKNLGQVEYYTNNGFTTDFEPGNLKPAIPVPSGSNLIYVALPSVSWNNDLHQFMDTGEADTGFWMAESQNLTDWSTPAIIYDFKQNGGEPHSILKVGQKWDSYPTFLSESQSSSKITNEKGLLYHSSGDNLTPHEPAVDDATVVTN